MTAWGRTLPSRHAKLNVRSSPDSRPVFSYKDHRSRLISQCPLLYSRVVGQKVDTSQLSPKKSLMAGVVRNRLSWSKSSWRDSLAFRKLDLSELSQTRM